MREPLIITLSAPIIKASTSKDGRRIVELEVSNEKVDAEDDVILQSALLGSAPSFVKNGHADIDHISELGERLGIANPTSYIVGRPTEVFDMGEGVTGARIEIFRSADGKHNAKRNKYDELWDSLNTVPPVLWRASIFGFPISDMVEDCRDHVCDKGARRFLVKGIDWRSLAFTRNPVNTAITGYAKVVSAKSYVEAFKNGAQGFGAYPLYMSDGSTAPAVADPNPPFDVLPESMDALVGQYHRHIKNCGHTGGYATRLGFQDHFIHCCGAGRSQAEVLANALMYHCSSGGRV